MSQEDDKRLLEQIRSTVADLNKLFHEASQYKIEFRADLTDITTYGDPVRVRMLIVSEFRRVEPL